MPRRPRRQPRPRPVRLAVTLSGFEDGARYTDRPLLASDRWAMQAADSATIRLAAEGGRAACLTLAQHPRLLAPGKASVGAVLWDGALALAAALVAAERPPGRLLEFGAGAGGLPSLVAASLGWAATATDRAPVLPLLAANVAANGGRVAVAELDWSAPGAARAAATLAGGASLLLAADCVYVDPGDPRHTPDAAAFVAALAAAAGASTPHPPAWVSVEPRSAAALDAFLAAAGRAFRRVTRAPPPTILRGEEGGGEEGGGEEGGGGGEECGGEECGGGWALDHVHIYVLEL